MGNILFLNEPYNSSENILAFYGGYAKCTKDLLIQQTDFREIDFKEEG